MFSECSDSRSTSSTISTAAIQSIVDKLRLEKNKKTTRSMYYGVWKNFNKFIIRLDNKPKTWEDRIILYTGYLVDSNLKSTTIRSYLSGIRSVLADDGVILNEDRCLLNSLTRACKLINDRVRTRLPIQRGMLNVLLLEIDNLFLGSGQEYLAILYQALFSTSYFGLFRVSELTYGEHAVKAKDVHLAENKSKLLFILHSSKTHGRGSKPQFIKISSSSAGGAQISGDLDKHCPYTLLRRFLEVRQPYSSDAEQFFVFSDGSPVYPHHLRDTLKMTLKSAGFNEKLYSTGSWRAGRAVDLKIAGVELPVLKQLGRWRSNAVFTYLAFS